MNSEKIKFSLIGIYLLIFLISLAVASFLTYIFKIGDSLIRALIYIGCSGGIGGTIYSIRGFYQNLGDNNFKFNWVWWYIFRPIISIVIGVFVYFLIVGGLLSVSATTEIDYTKGILFYCAIAFLAGFSFTQFASKLEEISSTIFSKNKKEKNGK